MYVLLHKPSFNYGLKFPMVLARYIYYKLRYKDAEKAYERWQAIAKRFEQSEYVAIIMYLATRCRPRKWMEETQDILFEGMLFPAPVDYDAVLRERYGDYMTPVKGTEFHQLVFFDTDRPYTDFI